MTGTVLDPDGRPYSRNKTAAALLLAGVDDTLLWPTVHIAPSPLLMARRWQPVTYRPAEDQATWGTGTQL